MEWLDTNGLNTRLLRLIYGLMGKLTGRTLRYYHTNAFASVLHRNLCNYGLQEYDLLFSIGSSDIAFLKTDVPIIHLADATFAQMVGYYDNFDMGEKRNREANIIQKKAYWASTQLIFMSQWAASSAREDYDVPEDKINVLRFGANQDVPGELREHHENGTLRMLFVGKEWERKGGQIAVDTLNALRQRGIDSTLTMVGCAVPQEVVNTPGLRIVPYLEDVSPFFRDADIFLLPTRAECAGIVFCEASAYGLPCFTTDTGGISDYVEEGVNGCLLGLDATGEDFADSIADICADADALGEMRRKARDRYVRELNWDVWMRGFEGVVKKALSKGR